MPHSWEWKFARIMNGSYPLVCVFVANSIIVSFKQSKKESALRILFANYISSTIAFMQRLRLIALNIYMASTHRAYSGVPNGQTRLTIYTVRKKCKVFFYSLQKI